jgi:hypothetical protein
MLARIIVARSMIIDYHSNVKMSLNAKTPKGLGLNPPNRALILSER